MREEKGLWDKTKEITSDVWEGTKDVTGNVWEGTKNVTEDLWEGTKHVAGSVKDAFTSDDDEAKKMPPHAHKTQKKYSKHAEQ